MKKEIALMTPVSKDLLYVKIADAIHGYIRENNLKPGDRLPSERALSQQLGTGRHSVREALRVLENQGIIEVRMGAGTFVAEETQDNSLYMEFVKINYMEMLNIKVELEKYAVKLSMKKLEEKELQELAGYLEAIEKKAAADGGFLYEEDKKFHGLLVDKSGNKMLSQMIEDMIETFDTYYSVLPQNQELCVETIPYHCQLLTAIRNQDIKGIEDAYNNILELDSKIVDYYDK